MDFTSVREACDSWMVLMIHTCTFNFELSSKLGAFFKLTSGFIENRLKFGTKLFYVTLFVIYLFKSASTDSPSNKQANENNWMSKGSCRFIAPGHKHQGQGNSTCLFCLLCKQVLYSWPKPLFSGLKKIG